MDTVGGAGVIRGHIVALDTVVEDFLVDFYGFGSELGLEGLFFVGHVRSARYFGIIETIERDIKYTKTSIYLNGIIK